MFAEGLPHSFLLPNSSHGIGRPVAMERTLAKGALRFEDQTCQKYFQPGFELHASESKATP